MQIAYSGITVLLIIGCWIGGYICLYMRRELRPLHLQALFHDVHRYKYHTTAVVRSHRQRTAVMPVAHRVCGDNPHLSTSASMPLQKYARKGEF